MSLLYKKFKRQNKIRKNKIRSIFNKNNDLNLNINFNNIEELYTNIIDELKVFEVKNIEIYNKALLKIQNLILKLIEISEWNNNNSEKAINILEDLRSEEKNYLKDWLDLFNNFKNIGFEISRDILIIFFNLEIKIDNILISDYFMNLINLYKNYNSEKIDFMFSYFSRNIEWLFNNNFNEINYFLITFYNKNKFVNQDVYLFFEFYFQKDNLRNELYEIYFYFLNRYKHNNNEEKMNILLILNNGLKFVKNKYLDKLINSSDILEEIFNDWIVENQISLKDKQTYIEFFVILSIGNEKYELNNFFEKIELISKTIHWFEHIDWSKIILIYCNLKISNNDFDLISNSILYNDNKKLDTFNNFDLLNFSYFLNLVSNKFRGKLEIYYEQKFKEFLKFEIKSKLFNFKEKLSNNNEIENYFNFISNCILFYLKIKKNQIDNNQMIIVEEFVELFQESIEILAKLIKNKNYNNLIEIHDTIEDNIIKYLEKFNFD